jgi:hypothetical protein
VQLDDETRNALILFNARLAAQEEQEREKRRVDKASKAKDDAAATVRRLENDPQATAEQKASAQTAYLASLDALNRAKSGEPDPDGSRDESTDESAADGADADAGVPADDNTDAEVSADADTDDADIDDAPAADAAGAEAADMPAEDQVVAAPAD